MKAKQFLQTILFLLPLCGWSQDSLYCTSNAFRDWWDVQHLTLEATILPDTDSIFGKSTITAKVIKTPGQLLQIDLQQGLNIEKIICNNVALNDYTRTGNAYLIKPPAALQKDAIFKLEIAYRGKPKIAVKAPWDGGFIRTKDENGKPWLAVACQGLGASLWFPCKDFPNDEPDKGVDMYYTTQADLSAIGNGRLISKRNVDKGLQEWHWRVSQPINWYNITFYIGDYVHWTDTFNGLKGKLDLGFYVLKNHLQKAKKQFAQVKPMLSCFEHWMGAYPFYEDGYKLVEAPYLGMEHQSAIAYGNGFANGYLGKDRSKTGVGLGFDFIIAHESGHEWFGNNVSASDVAYSWIHEGFTTYTETLFAECLFGKEKAFRYQRGEWRTIQNDKSPEGTPNQCDGGSSDHYSKASAVVHTIRIMLDDDLKFRKLLHDINTRYSLQTVSGPALEAFIIEATQLDLKPIFEQYLRSAQIPKLNLQKNKNGKTIYYWTNCIPNFNMPLKMEAGKKSFWLSPTTQPKAFDIKLFRGFKPSKDFYITY